MADFKKLWLSSDEEHRIERVLESGRISGKKALKINYQERLKMDMLFSNN